MIRARAVAFIAPRRVEVQPIEVRERESLALVRTAFSGISGGTESLAFRGEIDPDLALDETIGALGGTFRYPFRYGYACVGEVERGAGGLEPGTLVFAFQPHQDLFAAEPAELLPIEGIEPRLATLLPLVETALQVALDAGSVGEEDVVVVGQGTVGVLTALVLQRFGARVLGVEPNPSRREIAAAAGVETVEPSDVVDTVRDITDGRGVPVVVESSGDPAVPGRALSLLAHEGMLLVASWYGTKKVSLPMGAEFHRRRLTVRSTQVSSIPAALSAEWSRERRRAAARGLLEQLPLKLLATHEFPLDDAQRAFEAVDQPANGLMHAALRYP
ncbi:MAG: zinc-binding alcohol dehydrogenase [Actinomycetota bacterium]|nr:zinc-binding alcohol dehydrogenase [Actinomycetota bacterium]